MRLRPDVIRAIALTSLVWLLIFALILFHFVDQPPSTSQGVQVRPQRYTNDDSDREVKSVKDEEKTHEDADPKVKRQLDKILAGLSFSLDGPGAHGAAAEVPDELQAEKDKRFAENQFNVMASEMVSVNRTLPDYRSNKCKEMAARYVDMNLPKTSIIIVFHNEAFSTLLRTLHSVLSRSPHQYLEEIILIDDLSDRDYLKAPLDLYVKRFPIPTHIVHLKARSGLIRARLTGSEMAKGKVLLFLDAHVEVTEGWLEPLLVRVAQDRKRVVAPIIDVISDDNFEYITASDTTWGGFNWHLNFRWYPVPKREMQRRNNDRSSVIQTPTIAGGLFAIDRRFFYDIGSYDEGMQVWGGENLEISFRTWMCGGSLEIQPCSRVGHVFRKQTPYTFPGGTAKVIHHNAARTAEVWMDQYKEFFFKMVPSARAVDPGDLTARQKLRQDLQCKDFRWYLENIYPEAPVPLEFLSLGYVKNPGSRLCFDTMGKKDGAEAGLSPCHGAGGNQAWSLTGRGELRSDELCLNANPMFGSAVHMEKCSTTSVNLKHVFVYIPEQRHLRSKKSGRCLAATAGEKLTTAECDNMADDQKWNLEGYRS